VYTKGSSDPGSIEVQVSDTGRGIALRDQEHIFDPFWQDAPPDALPDGSTGLGLSVARQLARLLGGDVRLTRSEVGVGSSFVITLPVRYSGAASDA
jgi:signal transduction histidine kinase